MQLVYFESVNANKVEIIQLLKEGLTNRQIIKKFPETNEGFVYFWRRKLGLNLPPSGPRGYPRTEKTKAICIAATRMKVAGYTYAAIGKTFGLSRNRIQAIMRPKGVDLTLPCALCGKTTGVMHCHHTDYATGAFVILCQPCHRKAHKKKNSNLKGITFAINEELAKRSY